MELLETIVLLVAAVLLSAVFEHFTKRTSLPLVQMVIGVAIALFAGGVVHVDMDSELFLAVFIAPLLFDETRHVSKRDLMKNLSGVLSLAIGLVVVTMLAIGFLLHALEPSIPLAAAFALGAALGPTDAVAVSSLSESVSLSKRQKALLAGEALVNDASGIVSFQFAAAAAVTGAFSLADAGQSFSVLFAGGLVLGAVIGLVAIALTRVMHDTGLSGTAVHVAFELLVPFAAFILGESLHVSGVLAVVAAGLLIALVPHGATVAQARVAVVSSGVWETLSFLLNGVVFVMLGLQLPAAFLPSWQGALTGGELVGYVLAVTAVVVGARFLWVLAMNLFDRKAARSDAGETGAKRRRERAFDSHASMGELVRDALVTTLAGPKGAVTLSIVLTLPLLTGDGSAFPYRDELIFIASGTIVCTLLAANYLVPLLSPRTAGEDAKAIARARVIVLDRVWGMLRERGRDEGAAAWTVLRRLEQRIVDAAEDVDGALEYGRELAALEHEVRGRQLRLVTELEQAGHIEPEVARLARWTLEQVLRRPHGESKRQDVKRAWRTVRFGLKRSQAKEGDRIVDLDRDQLTEICRTLDAEAVACLEEAARSESRFRAQAARRLLSYHEGDGAEGQWVAATVEVGRGGILARSEELSAEALRYELDVIAELRDEGKLTRAQAAELREETYLMQMGTAV